MKKIIPLILSVLLLLSVLPLPLVVSAEEVTPPDNDFRTPLQYGYLLDNYENYAAYVTGAKENSKPRGIICDFSGDGFGEEGPYVFQKADDPEFTDPREYTDLKEPVYTVQNVLLGEHFYWRGGTDLETIGNSPVHEVTVTDLAPRMCLVAGVTNVRDIGGYASSLVPGAKLRQGRYYRGARLDSIKEAGKIALRDELGVRAEIDLRGDGENKGPYVDGITYYSFEIPAGTEPRRFEDFAEEYVGIYTTIANADKAPVYLHCTVGADRTGIATFMLLAVCGVSYEDIARDYLMTNFSYNGERTLEKEFNIWWKKLGKLEGDTVPEKAETWMKSKGVSEETIERIREVFIEGYISDIHMAGVYTASVSDTCYLESDTALVLKSTAPAEEFIGIKVDGITLSDGVYTYDSESGELTLPHDLVADLGAGEHTFSLVSEGGTAEGVITVKEGAPEENDPGKEPAESGTGENDPGKTPENDVSPWLWIALGIAAAAVVAAIVVVIVKKSNKASK